MKLLTVKDVRARVKQIAGMVGDNESAHSAEDDLYAEVLRAIGEGLCEDPRGCANAALKTESLAFRRWYA